MSQTLKIALTQIAPVWMNKQASLEKIATYIEKAADKKANLIVFGEGGVPGYPGLVHYRRCAV